MTALATARRLQARAVDDALDLFEVLMSTELLARAERESGKDKLRRYPRISRDAGRLAAAVGVLLEATERGAPISLDQLWDAIENVVSRSALRAAVEHVAEVLPPPDADPDGEWRERLLARYPAVRGFVPMLCQVIEFDATAEAAPVLAALQVLPDLLEARATVRVPAGFLDARRVEVDLVPAAWWRCLVFPAGRPDGTVDRAVDWAGYVFCLLEQFHRHLNCRNIFAAASTRWCDPRAQLLSGGAWQAAKGSAPQRAATARGPRTAAGQETRELDEAWRQAAAVVTEHAEIAVDGEGRLHAAKLDAVPDPPSLTDLRARLESMLPRVDLPELVLEVVSWQPAFLDAFTAASGGSTRLTNLNVTVTAALCAHALNIGFAPILDETSRALSWARVSQVDQNYLRPDTSSTANRVLIDAPAGIELARSAMTVIEARLRRLPCGAHNDRVIEAVVFDLDGVLIDSEPVWEQVRRAYVKETGGRWPPDAQDRLMGMSTSEWASYLSDEAGIDQPPDQVATAVVERMADRYVQALPLLPGAIEALGRLGDRWPLGLASSSPRSLIEGVLEAAGLSDRFAVTVSTEEVEHGKPSPDVYRAAVRGLGLSPGRCVAVEDSTNGLLAAAAAGMVTVAVPRPRYPPSADALDGARLVATDLDQLTVRVIEGLGRR